MRIPQRIALDTVATESPCVMIGNLKRYRREDLLHGCVSFTVIERRAKDAADCAEKGESWEGATPV